MEAVDGKTLTKEELQELGVKKFPNYADPIRKRELTIGEVGCFISHYNIWQVNFKFASRHALRTTGEPYYDECKETRKLCSFKAVIVVPFINGHLMTNNFFP